MLRKYSYPPCTFVILTAPRLAVGLELGSRAYWCPSPGPPPSPVLGLSGVAHPSRRAGNAGCNSLFDNLSRFAGVSAAGARRACPEQRRKAKSRDPDRGEIGVLSPLKGILCDKSLCLKYLHPKLPYRLANRFIFNIIDVRGGGSG